MVCCHSTQGNCHLDLWVTPHFQTTFVHPERTEIPTGWTTFGAVQEMLPSLKAILLAVTGQWNYRSVI